MTYRDLERLLEPLGIPFALHHWEHPPNMPYGVYFDSHTENFAADGVAYAVVRSYTVELYVRRRDPDLEARLEGLLTAAGLFWDKDAVYIDTERFFQISYEIEA